MKATLKILALVSLLASAPVHASGEGDDPAEKNRISRLENKQMMIREVAQMINYPNHFKLHDFPHYVRVKFHLDEDNRAVVDEISGDHALFVAHVYKKLHMQEVALIPFYDGVLYEMTLRFTRD